MDVYEVEFISSASSSENLGLQILKRCFNENGLWWMLLTDIELPCHCSRRRDGPRRVGVPLLVLQTLASRSGFMEQILLLQPQQHTTRSIYWSREHASGVYFFSTGYSFMTEIGAPLLGKGIAAANLGPCLNDSPQQLIESRLRTSQCSFFFRSSNSALNIGSILVTDSIGRNENFLPKISGTSVAHLSELGGKDIPALFEALSFPFLIFGDSLPSLRVEAGPAFYASSYESWRLRRSAEWIQKILPTNFHRCPHGSLSAIESSFHPRLFCLS